MYGPPPCRKRKVKRQGGLRKCIRPLVEFVTPGQNGMRTPSSYLTVQS
jgi:hypothetical protein